MFYHNQIIWNYPNPSSFANSWKDINYTQINLARCISEDKVMILNQKFKDFSKTIGSYWETFLRMTTFS